MLPKTFKLQYLLLPAILILCSISYYFLFEYNYNQLDEYKIGVLYSKKGLLAESEKPIINAIYLAAEELNSKPHSFGGRKLKIIFRDASDDHFDLPSLAEKLITEDKVDVLFACWTSDCRKQLKSVVERNNSLMLYVNQYEGLETSPNIAYLGATPNQQMIPAIKWMLDHYGKRVYLIGSDYIYPHVANELARLQIKAFGGSVVGKSYVQFQDIHMPTYVKDIKEAKPDFIINTINGSDNISFFNLLFKDSEEKIPVMSFSLSDGDLGKIVNRAYPYIYEAWTYNKNSKYTLNQSFLKKYRKTFGSTKSLNDPAVTAYAGMYLLSAAVSLSPNDKPMMVRDGLLRQSVSSPAGPIYIDSKNANSWREVHLFKLNKAGQSQEIWSSGFPLRPEEYPLFKSKIEWEIFLYKLYLKWNKSWGIS